MKTERGGRIDRLAEGKEGGVECERNAQRERERERERERRSRVKENRRKKRRG